MKCLLKLSELESVLPIPKGEFTQLLITSLRVNLNIDALLLINIDGFNNSVSLLNENEQAYSSLLFLNKEQKTYTIEPKIPNSFNNTGLKEGEPLKIKLDFKSYLTEYNINETTIKNKLKDEPILIEYMLFTLNKTEKKD